MQFLLRKSALRCLAVVALVGATVFNPPTVTSQSATVRLAMVNVPDDVIRPLLPTFEKQTWRRGEIVYAGNDPFAVAREGKADLVISHYGHQGVEPFVTQGFGLWPHPVFANQMALIGPSSDPAKVRGLTDAAEALRRIAASKSTARGYLDSKVQGPQAAREAAQKGAYLIWGVPPFLRLKRQTPMNLEALVTADAIFQRIMVAIIVNPAKVSGANADGARTFQDFLIAPATQAAVRAFRYPDLDQQVWWPAGRHNSARE